MAIQATAFGFSRLLHCIVVLKMLYIAPSSKLTEGGALQILHYILHYITNPFVWKEMTRFRISAHRLMIERGRQCHPKIELDKTAERINLLADDEMKLQAMKDILIGKMVKRVVRDKKKWR